jgi:hypothetical protein
LPEVGRQSAPQGVQLGLCEARSDSAEAVEPATKSRQYSWPSSGISSNEPRGVLQFSRFAEKTFFLSLR